MTTRRKSLMVLTCALVALGMLVVPVLADELMGRITAVNASAKKITVKDEGGKDVDVTITDETIYVTPKGERKVDLEKLAQGVEKAKEKGGIPVTIKHEKGVASEIKVQFKKKQADQSNR